MFKALDIDTRYIGAVEKGYNPAEQRVPAGSGRTSGEWTDGESAGEDDGAEGSQGSSLLGRMPLPPSSFLGELDAGQVAELGAYASRKVPIDFGPGVPAFRIDSAVQIPLDPTFPKSIFHVPWIAYLSPELGAGVTLMREVLTERTRDGGLLMTATEERLDPTNPEHVLRARILAETLIAQTGSHGASK